MLIQEPQQPSSIQEEDFIELLFKEKQVISIDENYQSFPPFITDIPHQVIPHIFSPPTTHLTISDDLNICEINSAIIYDKTMLRHSFHHLQSVFSVPSSSHRSFHHCLAIKTCPISAILQLAVECGLGLEAASISEVIHAICIGCPPHAIVFDSPAKTVKEIGLALSRGVYLNANSLEEVDKIAQVVDLLEKEGNHHHQRGGVGLRINPSQIKLTNTPESNSQSPLCVSNPISKFGVSVKSYYSSIIQKFKDYDFLEGLHVHSGSQHLSLDDMANGIQIILDLANDINCHLGCDRVRVIDIGGGLPVDYRSDSTSPTFQEYKNILETVCPSIFTSFYDNDGIGSVDTILTSSHPYLSHNLLIITEFGRGLVAKYGSVVSMVEDIWDVNNSECYNANTLLDASFLNFGVSMKEDDNSTEEEEGEEGSVNSDFSSSPPDRIAVIQTGADLFLRQCYNPTSFGYHRMEACTIDGKLIQSTKQRKNSNQTSSLINSNEKEIEYRVERNHFVTGPLCFGGDVLAPCWVGGELRRGDLIMFKDAGANLISMFSHHCSRQSSPVYFYERDERDGSYKVDEIRSKETIQMSIQFWG